MIDPIGVAATPAPDWSCHVTNVKLSHRLDSRPKNKVWSRSKSSATHHSWTSLSRLEAA